MTLIRRPLHRAMVGLAGIALAACAGSSPTPPIAGAARTQLPRELTAAERTVLSSANAFSFALWNRINAAQRDSNVFVSPLSASFSLGMTLNGAANQTFDEMRTSLQFGNAPLSDIDAGYKSLIGLLTTLDPNVTVQIANSIWYSKTFAFNKPFLDAATTWFDATTSPLDFSNQPAALAAINGWVSAKTNNRIPTIMDKIPDNAVMFLINAIYFKASWRSKFDPAETRTETFHSVRGDQSASLMHKHGSMSYAETATYQAVDLPYGDSAFTMTVLLPKEGTTVETLAASLTPQSWNALAGSFRTPLVDLTLPKLRLAWERILIPDLQGLGMRVPFIGDVADFTPMSPAGNHLYISVVKQKTFVEVNEEGTEAAAVTNTGVSVTSAPQTMIMRVDRPYVLAIRERLSGTVLFMGKIVRLP